MPSASPKQAQLSDIALLIDAIDFAAFKHREQNRKGHEKTPYINHPVGLARVLAVEGGVTDIETLAAAVLHDTIEDTKTTYAELERRFGRTVADVVVEVTDVGMQPKRMRKVMQIQHAPHLSERAKLVKLADKICNLRDMIARPPEGWSLARRQEYFDWATRVVEGLGDVHPGLEKEFGRVARLKPK